MIREEGKQNSSETKLARLKPGQNTCKNEGTAEQNEPGLDPESVGNEIDIRDGESCHDDADEDEVAGGAMVLVLIHETSDTLAGGG